MSLAQKIKEAGVVGAGGGAFPTHVKASSKVEFVLANGAECEPLIHKDVEIMKAFPKEILDGMSLMMEETSATKGYFGIKGKNKGSIAAIDENISGKNIEVSVLGDFYPAGDEYELVYSTTGRLIPPYGIPLDIGCIVNNVETFYNINNANKGIPVTEKFLSVTGLVKNPSSFFAPIGITFRELIEFAGGTKIDDFAIFISGLLMGKLTFDLDTAVTKSTSGIIIIPKDHYLVKRVNRPLADMNRIGKSACDQCSYCTEFCPRYLLGYDVQPHKVMRSLEFTQSGEALWNQYASLCCSCGLCTLYSCPEELYPREACDQSKVKMKSDGFRYEQTKPVEVHPIKEGRRVPTKQLMKKLNMLQFEQPTPYIEDKPLTNKVKIPVQQHIGAPSEPVVEVGSVLRKGDLIARIKENALGANIHSSIDGKVTSINNGHIIIEKF